MNSAPNTPDRSLFQHTSSFCSFRAENLLFLAGGCWGRWSFVLELEQGWGCGSRAVEEGWG